ncbi:uncharacterized protein L969DRAFT_42167 [Mixia osmundae IAM 14324]|uniref:Serine aminopeptidase S33 domain-containing protein n=1 Tax=Mixia osmundae (strain CBS 9802 / IAM 14324 / JCM 22182 / KY 12970) TaxID=764103 RepID=G7E068_MIXOS|nr:uncharacterized protein L969DRAFT_42167 [Mixia osmundae IAM 14324]KEI42218.1 hypothetical protein L969DRAFT_42167 [Mixia osmundae IAM 14324]GAA96228.1 hypothetical protein E5Q_02892 [Mixia osmundae IAM 14324]
MGYPDWQVPSDAASKAYYAIKAPHTVQSTLRSCVSDPVRALLGYKVDDPTYGRAALPRSPLENSIRQNGKYTIRDGKVLVEGSTLKAKADQNSPEPSLTQDWISYQTWQDEAASKDKGIQADFVFCHGINDYGSKFSEHAGPFLEAGYRVITVDLPSHGRSTGLHVHVPDMALLIRGLHAALVDTVKHDAKKANVSDVEAAKRSRILSGQSLGGFVAVYYLVHYQPPRSTEPGRPDNPAFDGALFLCPMLSIAPESRPSLLVEYAGRSIAYFFGRLPFADANKGKNSEDQSIEQEFQTDPQTYHGKLRIATGIAIIAGIDKCMASIEKLSLPFKVIHGTGDRVIGYKSSQSLHDRASSKDKSIKLFEGYEHMLLRKGHDTADDQRRQNVLREMLDWLKTH